jgi:hypothetical protein
MRVSRLSLKTSVRVLSDGAASEAVVMQRNALIDGFRGLSIALVIAGHLIQFRFQDYLQPIPVIVFKSTDKFLPTSL